MIPDFMLVHEASLEAYEGTGAYGDVYASPVQVDCYVEDVTKIVLSSTGEEVVSMASLFCNVGPDIPPGSRITLPSGRVATVIKAAVLDDDGLTGLGHVEVNLT